MGEVDRSGHRTVSSAESSRGIYFVTNTDDWYAFTNPEDAFDDRLTTAVAAVEAFTPTDQAQKLLKTRFGIR